MLVPLISTRRVFPPYGIHSQKHSETTTPMNNTALNTLDFGFTALEKISEFDYVAFGSQVVETTATVTAVVVGFASYLWLALQLFWEDHGETITVGATKSVILTVDFAGNCLIAGRKFRLFANRMTATLADRAYYAATAL